MRRFTYFLATLILGFFSLSVTLQTQDKQQLESKDYGQWQSITTAV